jgi:hypothetical protein
MVLNDKTADAVMRDGNEQVILSGEMNGSPSLPVSADDFSPLNKIVFNRIRGLPKGKRNLLAVTAALRKHGELERVGGAGRITEISLLPHDDDSVEYALGEMLDASRQRQATKICDQLRKRDITLAEALPQLQKLNEARSDDLPAMQDAAALLSAPIALPDDVIEGMLHRGGKMVMGGASKSYKTWLLIDLGVSVATGSEWFNGYPTQKGRVLYVNFELPAPFFAQRIATVCDERQLTLEPGMLCVWNLRGHVADWAKLQSQIQSDFYALIILDPTYKLLLGRDENKAGDIASLMNEFEMLAVRSGAAVAFGAHYSKGNQAQKEAIDRIGGSGVFARDPDTILSFTRHEEADCFTVEMTLRNHPPREAFVVRWEFPLFAVENLLDPAQLKQAGRKPDESFAAEKIFELLTKPMSTKAWQKLAADELGASRATFFRRKDALETEQKIRKDAAGKWSQVS